MLKQRFLGCLLLSLIAINSYAENDDKQYQFRQFLQKISLDFNKKGIDRKILRYAFKDLKVDQTVINLDRKQPEFSLSFGQYLSKRITPKRVNQGIKQMSRYHTLLKSVENETGIPKSIIVSLWSLETNYGKITGNRYIIRSVATLAFDGRRRQFFTNELYNALKIMQQNGLTIEEFKGSWAGAMGQPQFMPSTFVNYAVDGNNDGQINLWRNMHDVFYSAANYLNEMSWQQHELWGQEVILPQKMDWTKSGLEWSLPIERWIKLGVKPVNGITPTNQHQRKASIILPMGYGGPAFMVYDNLRTILKWNNSLNYAITVGILADLLEKRYSYLDLPLDDWKRNYPPLKTVIKLQKALIKSGFNIGAADGIIGSKTRQAIIKYQIANQLIPDGYPNPQLLDHLEIH